MGQAERNWWLKQKPSHFYSSWELGYKTTEPPELTLPRPLLSKFLAMRTGHGDFAGYHQRFGHDNAAIRCGKCSAVTAPEHIVHCPNSVAKWKNWPAGPKVRPNAQARSKYFYKVLKDPNIFKEFAALTGFFETPPR